MATDGPDARTLLGVFLDTHCKGDREAGIQRLWDDLVALRGKGGCESLATGRDATAGGDILDPAGAGGIRRFGPYEILRELGRGSQGVVFEARDTRLGRTVALKTLRDVAGDDHDAAIRFLQEAEIACRTDDPGICTVYEAGSIGSTPYIAMRLVRGVTLASLVPMLPGADGAARGTPESRPRSWPEGASRAGIVVPLVEEVARSLHAAHECGVVHRDLKPSNIMIDETGRPVITDFGLSRVEDGTSGLTRTGEFLGTPAYASPEQLSSAGAKPDRRTDVWSLGVILHECLAGRRPFQSPTREGLYRSILHDDPPRLRNARTGVDCELEIVVRTALAKERARRYQTALDLAEDLARIRRREPILARKPTAADVLRHWVRRHPGVALASCAATLLLLAGLTVALVLLARLDASSAIGAARLAAWDRLADGRRLDDLIHASRVSLWPAFPDRLPAMASWLNEARELLGRRPACAAALETLRARAAPYSESDRAADAEAFERARAKRLAEQNRRITEARERHGKGGSQIDRLRKAQRELEGRSDAEAVSARKDLDERIATATDSRDRQTERIRESEERIAEIGRESPARSTYSFGDVRDRLQHDQLSSLLERMGMLEGGPGADQASISNMQGRIELARSIQRRCVDDALGAWRQAAERLRADPRFGSVALEPVMGLVPLGPDPDSGLEEFADTSTGEPVARDEKGGIVIREDSGVVFVLVPGGEAATGSQKSDPAAPHYDPRTAPSDAPIQTRTLAPFLLSKYEMTQGQWLRLAGSNPSMYGPGTIVSGRRLDLRHPVERLSHDECGRILARAAMRLPTEVEWESACRAGTTTPWPFPIEELRGHANLADKALRDAQPLVPSGSEPWTDGWSLHAPVGSFGANAFGFHDSIGNVAEWCLDPQADGNVVARGGAFLERAADSRVTTRVLLMPTVEFQAIGVRPARSLPGGTR